MHGSQRTVPLQTMDPLGGRISYLKSFSKLYLALARWGFWTSTMVASGHLCQAWAHLAGGLGAPWGRSKGWKVQPQMAPTLGHTFLVDGPALLLQVFRCPERVVRECFPADTAVHHKMATSGSRICTSQSTPFWSLPADRVLLHWPSGCCFCFKNFQRKTAEWLSESSDDQERGRERKLLGLSTFQDFRKSSLSLFPERTATTQTPKHIPLQFLKIKQMANKLPLEILSALSSPLFEVAPSTTILF